MQTAERESTAGAPAPMRAPAVDELDDSTPGESAPESSDDLLPEDDLDLSWQADGKCAATDADGNALHGPDEFFLEGRFSKNSREYKEAAKSAKAVCNACPARKTCLQFAIDNKVEDGIWGGMTYWERRAMRYPRRRVNGKLTYIKGEPTE